MHLALATPVLATVLLAGAVVIALLSAPWQLALGATAGLAAVLGWHPSPDQPALLMLTMAATIVLLVLPQLLPGRPPWRHRRNLFQASIMLMGNGYLHTCEPLGMTAGAMDATSTMMGMTNGATLNITPVWSRNSWADLGAVRMRN